MTRRREHRVLPWKGCNSTLLCEEAQGEEAQGDEYKEKSSRRVGGLLPVDLRVGRSAQKFSLARASQEFVAIDHNFAA